MAYPPIRFNRTFLLVRCAALATALTAVIWSARANADYIDTFDRTGSLAGSLATVDASDNRWNAPQTANTFLTKTTNDGEAVVTGGGGEQTAVLPFTVAGISTLSVTMTPTGGAYDTNYLAFGFVTAAPNQQQQQPFYDITGPWLSYQGGGLTQFYIGPSLNGGNSAGSIAPGTAVTFTLTIDNTDPTNPTITFADSAGIFKPGAVTEGLTQADVQAITGIGIASLNEAGTFTNLNVTTTLPDPVPEPATLVMVLMVATGALAVRRRNRR